MKEDCWARPLTGRQLPRVAGKPGEGRARLSPDVANLNFKMKRFKATWEEGVAFGFSRKRGVKAPGPVHPSPASPREGPCLGAASLAGVAGVPRSPSHTLRSQREPWEGSCPGLRTGMPHRRN